MVLISLCISETWKRRQQNDKTVSFLLHIVAYFNNNSHTHLYLHIQLYRCTSTYIYLLIFVLFSLKNGNVQILKISPSCMYIIVFCFDYEHFSKKLCINLVQLGIVEDDKKIDTYVHLLLFTGTIHITSFDKNKALLFLYYFITCSI